MQATNPHTYQIQQPLTIVLVVMLAIIGLFSLDRETHSIMDLFEPGNMIAFVIYFVPAFLISFFLFWLFSKKYERKKSLVLSLVVGIPLSFTLVIAVLILLMR
jgi:hypothetical protein